MADDPRADNPARDASLPLNASPSGADPATLALYDAFAAEYDPSFEARSLRGVYDQIAWSHVAALLPATPCTIVDVGCGTGRWVARCQAMGHRVIAVEPAPAMQRILYEKFAGTGLTLVAAGMEEAVLPAASAEIVLAMGSLQYATDPGTALRRMVAWLRPGGSLCVHVDGLVALTLELLRLGRLQEALTRLEEGWGVFSYHAHRARLHLFDSARLAALLTASGLAGIETRGLLVTPSALGRARCEEEIMRDEAAFLAIERRLSASPAMADAGKHVMAWGRRPHGRAEQPAA